MNDPVADAAAQLNKMQDAQQALGEVGKPQATADLAGTSSTQETLSIAASSMQSPPEPGLVASMQPADAPISQPASFTGNVLLNAAPVVDAPNVVTAEAAIAPFAVPTSTQPTSPVADLTSDALPRESHLMLLEAKIAGFRAKLANAERVALDEFEAIVGHIKAVL